MGRIGEGVDFFLRQPLGLEVASRGGDQKCIFFGCGGIVGQGAILLAGIGVLATGIQGIGMGAAFRHSQRSSGPDDGELGFGLLAFVAEWKGKEDVAVEAGRFGRASLYLFWGR